MDVRERLNLLGQAAQYDDYATPPGDVTARRPRVFRPSNRRTGRFARELPCVSHLQAPGGQRKAILKILQTSACQNDCQLRRSTRAATSAARM